MNKTAIRNFATWARRKLIEDITYKANLLGISEKGIEDELPQSTSDLKLYNVGMKDPATISGKDIKKRESLVEAIKAKEQSFDDYKKGFEAVIDEVAYTWFNRLIAIRFMEANDYLPSGVRVLSSESEGKREPDLVTNPFDSDLEFNNEERAMIFQLKDENKLDELFRMLFIKQCNSLHSILPVLFEETDDYSELLIPISFTDEEGIVHKLVNDIDEEDFREQVEIIGWLYQYYISEKKDEIINIYKGTIKKEDLPAATQLFTTDWVVRYMVDNSLGRYWIERNPESKLIDKLEYFVTSKSGEIKYIDEKISPEELTFFDPCMGSGHILVYAFDVLMYIYLECGYSEREAVTKILEKNLFGLDIDQRAYQLAYFALMMKARSYNRRIFRKPVSLNLAAIEESNGIKKFECSGMTLDKDKNKVGEHLVNVYKDAKEIGSLQTIEENDYKAFTDYLLSCEDNYDQFDIFSLSWRQDVLPVMLKLSKQADIMSRKYSVVCTNPPYANKLSGNLKKFVTDNYKDYSGDLFSVFMYRNFDYCKPNGYSGFMTPFVWMFIKTYEKLREYIITNKSITTLVQMEYSAFEEATVPICSFVLKNGKENQPGYYIRLSDFKGGMDVQKKKVLEALSDKNCSYFFKTYKNNFKEIPGIPIAYWANISIINSFKNGIPIGNIADCKRGMTTSDNNRFLRLWYEVERNKICLNAKSHEDAGKSKKTWFPYSKGGGYRKWYGYQDFLIDWENNGERVIGFAKTINKSYTRTIVNLDYYFKPSVGFSYITSGPFSMRWIPEGFLYDSGGPGMFSSEVTRKRLIACMNSKPAQVILKILSPTINLQIADIIRMPFIYDESKDKDVIDLVNNNINISKKDWDSFETSWNFKKHPLLCNGTSIYSGLGDIDGGNYPKSNMKKEESDNGTKWYEEGAPANYRLEEVFNEWSKVCKDRFNQLKTNEEKLNRIFIDIYGLQDELTPEVEEKDVTIRKADKERDIKSFISYAVGCMLGRYSLDVEGLAYAGGEWDSSKYKTFIPDPDNCIPITDEEYFDDDIVGRFVEFVKIVFGEKTLEENLKFIADALGTKGKTSREVIRNYFLKDFIKDHNKIYQKRPIYWMFDSGKQNGFKALVYMHRWDADTIGNMRIEYLHRMQRVYEKEIIRMQDIIDTSDNNKAIKDATKAKEKLQKQLKEAKDYDEKVAHLALSRINIDLDDGVKVNYEKVQTANDGKKLGILAKI